MTNGIASLFEDHHLKIFSECIRQIGAAETKTDVDLAVKLGKASLEHIKDKKEKTAAAQRLLMVADTAYLRLSR